MHSLLDAGIEIILWIQQLSPWLDAPFIALTTMGNEGFYLLLLPFVYWCVDRRIGMRLTLLFLVSAYLNALVKVLVAQPRPFVYDARVPALVKAAGYGFPSGHTQGAVVIWGYLAAVFRRRALTVAAVALMIGIPLSRVYLGVHFPTDLLGGYLIGGLLLVLFLVYGDRAAAWVIDRPLSIQLLLALGLPLLLWAVFPGGEDEGVTAAGSLAGMAAGFALEPRLVGFKASSRWTRRLAGYLLGIVVLAGLWIGLKIAFRGLEPIAVFRFARYLSVGLWGSLGAPWCLLRLRLVDRR